MSPDLLIRLWERMTAIYGHRWTSAYGDSPIDEGGAVTLAADTWGRGLVGVEPADIGAGLDACITASDPWPPTLPEFRARCLGVPSLSRIQAEWRAGGDRPSRWLYACLRVTDGYALRKASQREAERMIADSYHVVRDRVMRGEKLPWPPLAVAAPEPKPFTPASPEVVAAELAAAMAALGALAIDTHADTGPPDE